MTKRLIDAEAEYITSEIFDVNDQAVPLNEFIAKLQSINRELECSDWQDVKIFFGVELCDYGDGDLSITISGKRPETNKEEIKRLKAEARDEAVKKAKAEARANNLKRQEAAEIAELTRLKAKYEKENK